MPFGLVGAALALPVCALAAAPALAEEGWSSLFAVVREAGLGVGLLWLGYRALAPWAARPLEGQRERAREAEVKKDARIEALEKEALARRTQCIELVSEAATLRAGERMHRAELQAQAGETRIAQLERDSARQELRRLIEKPSDD